MELKPGRELDKLIHEKVMLKKITSDIAAINENERIFGCCTCGSDVYASAEDLPFYSTDIAAAWQVVEKVKNSGRAIEVYAPMGDQHWICRVYENGEIKAGHGSDTAPHSICLAALKAVGVEV